MMLKNDIAYYAVDRETHTMTVNEVTEGQVSFLVASEPKVEIISLNEEDRWDLDEDGNEDIRVKYLSKSGTAAEVRFSKVEEELTRMPLAVQEDEEPEPEEEEPVEVVLELEKVEGKRRFSPASILTATALLAAAVILYTKPVDIKKLKKQLRPKKKKPAKKKLFNPYDQTVE